MKIFLEHRKRTIVAVLLLMLGGVSMVILANRAKVIQPIAFNHKKHIDNNVPCKFCHRFYEQTRYAGIPTVQICATCHEDVIYLTPEKSKIQYYYQQGIEIPWRQIYKAADHVYFSHRLHVVVGKIECANCHGDMTRRVQPLTEQPIPLNMVNCIKCHKQVKSITNPYECIRCHR